MASEPAILTTTVGSYPVPDWLPALPSEQARLDATRVVFQIQRQARIDLPTDGELYRFTWCKRRGRCYDVSSVGLSRMTIAAKYENGVFKPLEHVRIEEGTVVEVNVPSYAERLKGKPRSVKDFAFYGMWKDRADIGDSVDYVNHPRSASRR